jgi:hypothetical protein
MMESEMVQKGVSGGIGLGQSLELWLGSQAGGEGLGQSCLSQEDLERLGSQSEP